MLSALRLTMGSFHMQITREEKLTSGSLIIPYEKEIYCAKLSNFMKENNIHLWNNIVIILITT